MSDKPIPDEALRRVAEGADFNLYSCSVVDMTAARLARELQRAREALRAAKADHDDATIMRGRTLSLVRALLPAPAEAAPEPEDALDRLRKAHEDAGSPWDGVDVRKALGRTDEPEGGGDE